MASGPADPSSRRVYAHGRKIHHIRFRHDGAVACHLFFIKTKTMKLQQLQQQAMQQAATTRQQLANTTPATSHAPTANASTTEQQQQRLREEKKEKREEVEEDDSRLLNSHLQQLYKQGRLGDNPYVVPASQPAPPPPPPPAPPAPPAPPVPRRFNRPPQPLTAHIPTLRIDPGPLDVLDEQKGEQQQQQQVQGQLHSRMSLGGRRVPLFARDCDWYLYPHQLSMAAERGEEEKPREAGRAKKTSSGRGRGGGGDVEMNVGMSAAEILVRSATIRAR